jgi:Icc-related predicted phosphoesterase
VVVTGYSNRTPWDTPREIDEEDMLAYLERMFAEVTNPTNLIAVIHPPPRDTDLDKAPEIDADFRIKLQAGSPKMISVGSSAVRTFIEQHQPLLGLHGHVHDSKGSQLIGRTLCINPGSEYTEGTLCGAIVAVAGDHIVSHQLVIG